MIYKTIKNKDYQCINNNVFVYDVSIEARCLLAYMLTKPDDWVFYNKAICSEFRVSKSKLTRLFKELKDYGLVNRMRVHVDGRFQWVTEVYESPQLNSTHQNTIDSNSEHCNSMHCKHSHILSTDTNQVLNKLNTESNISNKPAKKQELKPLFYNLVEQLGFTSRVVFSLDRERKLKARLKDFSAEQLMQAASSIASDEFLSGDNPQGKVYGTIDYLLRSTEIIERNLQKPKDKPIDNSGHLPITREMVDNINF